MSDQIAIKCVTRDHVEYRFSYEVRSEEGDWYIQYAHSEDDMDGLNDERQDWLELQAEEDWVCNVSPIQERWVYITEWRDCHD